MKALILQFITHLATAARNLVDDVREHHVLVVGLQTDAAPLHVLAQPHVVADERVGERARVRRLPVAEDDAGGDLFAHPIARRLVEAPPVAVTAPPVEQVAQQRRAVGEERRCGHPFGAQRTEAVGRQPDEQGAQELTALCVDNKKTSMKLEMGSQK